MVTSSLALMPTPFDWIMIPSGQVEIISIVSKERDRSNYIPAGTSQKFSVSSFEIAKYPITNKQFALFIASKGYEKKEYWTDLGWREKCQRNWKYPEFWNNAKWNQPDYPVVGISWYEATAFCTWLAMVTQENIRLPSEQQWQRAAQGDTQNKMAWGEDAGDEIRCNWDTEGTTPVYQYEGKGDSPFGVVDMNGNVWEWCLTEFQTGSTKLDIEGGRVCKGGGWIMFYSYEINIGNLDRMSLYPHYRLNYLGFRCVR